MGQANGILLVVAGLRTLGAGALLLGMGFLLYPDSNLLGGLGPLSWLLGFVGLGITATGVVSLAVLVLTGRHEPPAGASDS